jgi:tetratricopeptide (TPR) repeat protein
VQLTHPKFLPYKGLLTPLAAECLGMAGIHIFSTAVVCRYSWCLPQGCYKMKKKVAASIKRSALKPNRIHTVRSAKTMSAKKPAAPKPKTPFKEDPVYTQAVQNYEAGLKAMQEHKYEKAKQLLEKIVASGPRELVDRARMHLNSCNQQLASGATSFKSQDEHFDYAVSLMNSGQYDQSRVHMEKILKQNAKADFALYGLAVLDCLSGQVESSLKNLGEAIRLNPQNRFQARNDSDFQNMADDPRFTELLYPEPGEMNTSDPRKR